ncbi:hypothetical protein PVK06_018587 [Gossypium arboreum]|uniref:Reverse transcriptase n=1 Tax=Gossypium arboreum TaxID=29729 RepID=A0ABR0PHR9_GOSAR|nr:hypothetical protein PVK06_018587 [Gossypium arboreum]
MENGVCDGAGGRQHGRVGVVLVADSMGEWEEARIHGVLPGQTISHLQLADDMILFLKAEEMVVENMKFILRCLETFSGLSINFKKSCIVGFGVMRNFYTIWQLYEQIREGWLLGTWWLRNLERNWRDGNVEAPVSVIKRIDKIRRNFLWGGLDGKRKMAKVNWKQICRPKENGGARVVNLEIKNKALLAKWRW